MTPETVEEPRTIPDSLETTSVDLEKPIGVANSFSDSQRRRNRKSESSQLNTGGAQPAPTPLPKRPKGRFFVGSFLLLLIIGFFYAIWSAFFSVVAHGGIEGRKLKITPLQTGVVRTIHVRDGAFVNQGDPLITLEKIDSGTENESDVENQLNAAIHDFKVEIAKHRVNASLSNNQKAKARAEYLHWLGELLQEQSKLDDLIDQHHRSKLLTDRNSVGTAKLRSIEFELKGQRAKVEKLGMAVGQLEKNAASIETDVDFTDLIDAHQSKIKGLQQKLHSKKTESDTFVIKAPVAGKVIRISRFTGERVEPGEPLLELTEGGSVRPVLYLTQEQAAHYEAQSKIRIELKPNRGLIECYVERIGDEFTPVPEYLKSKIAKQAQVVPVFLRPVSPDGSRELLRLGSLIELPHSFSFSQWFANRPDTGTQMDESAVSSEDLTESSDSEGNQQ